MARQANPFALLGNDDEGDDVSVLLAKVEAMIPALPPSAKEQTKQKSGPNGFPSNKLPTPSEFVRGERGRGRGGRSWGTGRGGFGNVGGSDAIDQPEHLYDRGYNGESGGERSHGRSGRGGIGRGRGRGFTGFGNRNQLDNGNPGDGREDGSEFQEKGYYGEGRPSRYDSRKFGEENQGPDGEERENRGFKTYGTDPENHGLRGHGSDLEKREFRDGEGYERKREFRDGEGYERRREFRDGEGYERSYGGDGENRGFRGGEGRGRGYGGRGRRGGRDGGRGGGRYESTDGWNTSEPKKVSADEKEPTVNNTHTGDGSGRDDRSATEEPKDGQSEKPMPEQIASEETSKVPEEDYEMTLAEYEKLLQEKRKALESLKMETRKVVLDKDFEGMQIIEKKKEDLTKVKLDIDKGKKKEITEREEKSRKSQSINEFLKPADGERYSGAALSSRGRGGGRGGRGRGGYINEFPRQAAATAPSLEDPTHFPILGAAAKA